MKKISLKKPLAHSRLVVFSSIVALILGTITPLSVQAAQLDNRELTLESSAAGATTGHNYSFVIATSGDVGEMQFEYCNNNPFPGQSCTAPSGLDVSGVTIDGSVLINGTAATNSYSIDSTNTTTNKIVIDTATANTLSAGDVVEVDFDGAINPDSSNTEYFTRLYTYQSDAGSTLVDDGGLAFSTAETIDVTARVEENLIFCVFETGQSCGTPGNTTVDLGVLTTSTDRTSGHRAIVATNALHGFTIQYAGTTLTHSNGTDTISAIGATGTASSPGNEQFGLRIGIANTPTNTSTLDPDYSNSDCGDGTEACYAFVDGATVTDGGDSTTNNTLASATGPVDQNNFDLTFLGNVNATTSTGVYSTTVTYVATATF